MAWGKLQFKPSTFSFSWHYQFHLENHLYHLQGQLITRMFAFQLTYQLDTLILYANVLSLLKPLERKSH